MNAIAGRDVLTATAEANGVCIRPVLQKLTDLTTGETRTVAIACGSTRETKCRPCADKARRLRIQQCREGWHRTEEAVNLDPEDDIKEGEDEQPDEDAASARRVRSTRRRQDAADLPRVYMSDRTVGRELTAPSGKTYRPSMFLTLTLPSYGRVRSDGTPVDPTKYDYRRAALDAMHFSRLVDRFWQNLRRCAGYRVQYFSTVEEQKRLTPHLHAAVRGVVPRSVVLQVIAATYHQVWWPAFDEQIYTIKTPTWDEPQRAFLCPWSGTPLPTWEESMDKLDAQLEAEPATPPAHVVRFGKQADYKWLIVGSPRTDRVVGYLTKYLTKSIADTYDPELTTARQRAHIDRLMTEVRRVPCSPECANWLIYGIQPRDADGHEIPGACPRAAHDPDNLGYGGRRVLVSRDWTSKTLTEHKADRAAVVREALREAGIEFEETNRFSATCQDENGTQRFTWEPVNPTTMSHGERTAVLVGSIREHQQRQRLYEEAKRAGPTQSVRQPHSRVLPIASQPRSPGRLSGVRAANHKVTRSALDGQRGDQTIDRREANDPGRTERNGPWTSS